MGGPAICMMQLLYIETITSSIYFVSDLLCWPNIRRLYTSEHALRLGVGLNDFIQIVIVRGEEGPAKRNGESGCGTGASPKESSTKESASSSPKKRPRAETAMEIPRYVE